MSEELTAIQGRVLRPIGLDTFADITDVRLVLPDGIDRNGLLFDGPLDDDQIDAIHDRMTSRDDTDAAERAYVAALLVDEPNPIVRALGCRFLGLPVDLPPPPEPPDEDIETDPDGPAGPS